MESSGKRKYNEHGPRYQRAGADPVFSTEGVNPKEAGGGGANLLFGKIFTENTMNM